LDWLGAVRDLIANPVPKGDSGQTFQHLYEVEIAINGITKASQSIEKMLNNCNYFCRVYSYCNVQKYDFYQFL